ncbi:MAG: 6-carboxytetrahydropterin synthase QueD [Candidatus Latescibacteria bacterium]|nr:6-carboxytetrahydropterin synthase QueD [Candidatus Latescibacterota bacterium]
MYELTVESCFSAAHFLDGYNGDCSRMHGHTWKVSLTVGASVKDKNGLCMDFKDISSILDGVIKEFDHRTLNEVGILNGKNPTAENIAQIIFTLCVEKLNNENVFVHSVTVAESDRYRVTYREK